MTKAAFIFYVADQKKSAAFYSAVLETQPLLDVPGMTEFQISNECKLGLMPETGIVKILLDTVPHPSLGNGIPRCELYLFVDNVETIYARALLAGAIPVSKPAPRDWGDHVGYVSDLDGNILAFSKKITTV